MWEVICSLCRLQTRQGELVFGEWRRRTVGELSRHDRCPPGAVLKPLVPNGPYIPDFLTPTETHADPAAAIDTVLSTSPRRLRNELEMIGDVRGLPSWTAELADGTTAVLDLLGRALQGYFSSALEPVWQDLHDHVEADVQMRVRQLLDGGTEALLSGLPTARWEPPVLLLPYPADRDLHLAGRGLRLVPSYFCWRRVMTLVDRTLTPTLAYPVPKEVGGLHIASGGGSGRSALPALLGRTRALILESLATLEGLSTSELARGAGVTLPTASQQISVLRNAGLVTSRRDGKRVLHGATLLGRELVEGGLRPPRGGTAAPAPRPGRMQSQATK